MIFFDILISMKTLIVYYSRTGTTEKVAQEVAENVSCDIEHIVDKKKRNGMVGWIFGGRDGMEKNMTSIEPMKKDPSTYDLVILGTPIWIHCTPAMRTYIHLHSKKFKNVAFFCTMGSSDPTGLFSEMEELGGKKPIATMAITTGTVRSDMYHDEVQAFSKKIKDFRKEKSI